MTAPGFRTQVDRLDDLGLAARGGGKGSSAPRASRAVPRSVVVATRVKAMGRRLAFVERLRAWCSQTAHPSRAGTSSFRGCPCARSRPRVGKVVKRGMYAARRRARPCSPSQMVSFQTVIICLTFVVSSAIVIWDNVRTYAVKGRLGTPWPSSNR